MACALLLALSVLSCDPTPRAGGPEPSPDTARGGGSEAASVVPPGPNAEALRAVLEAAERFARLEAVFTSVQRIEAGRAVATQHYVREHQSEPVAVAVVGTRSGYPAYLVTPVAHQVEAVIVVWEEVLVGEPGFARYRELTQTQDATQLSSAWLILAAGLGVEPLGPWSEPLTGPPSWRDGELHFTYRVGNELPQSLALRFEPDGRVIRRLVHR